MGKRRGSARAADGRSRPLVPSPVIPRMTERDKTGGAAPPTTRQLLVRSLRNDGLGAVCRGEPRTHEDLSTRLSYVFMTAMTLGVTFILADWWELGFYGWLGVTAGLLLVLGLSSLWTSPQAAALVLALTWVALVVAQIGQGESGDLVETALVPFALTTAAVWILRGRRLTTVAKSAPLLLPVTLIVLVAPLVSEDVWEAADALGPGEIMAIASLTIVPLLIVFVRQLRTEVPEILDAAVAKVAQDNETQARAIGRTVRLVEEEQRDATRTVVEEDLSKVFSSGFSTDTQQAVTGALTRPLRRAVIRRAMTTAGGLAVAVFAYLFLLTWALVAVDVAEVWLDRSIPIETVAFPGMAVDVPTGPYVTIAALVGVIATAVLLAYVVTEESYSRELSAALLEDPIEDGLSVALPYQALREREPASGAA
jgi:hypothetical protein